MIRTLRSALLAAAMTVPMQAGAQGTLTVAMTAGDLPITTGSPDQGFEGFRFVAFSLYDALVGWDLSKFDKAAEVKAGLATSWEIDPANHRRWIFKLRESVAFHDGCPFTADDVVWNLTRYTDNKAPQFDTYQFALTRGYITNFESIEKVDSHTVAITTKTVDSQFFYPLSLVVMISKCWAEALKYDWAAYNRQPSGTGPFKFVARCRASAAQDPWYGLIRHVQKSQWAPAGANWGKYDDPVSEDLIVRVGAEFDAAKRLALLQQLNERMNDQAIMIWVAHDVNPRALSPKVKGFIQAQSWFQDLTPITVLP